MRAILICEENVELIRSTIDVPNTIGEMLFDVLIPKRRWYLFDSYTKLDGTREIWWMSPKQRFRHKFIYDAEAIQHEWTDVYHNLTDTRPLY